MRTYWKRMLFIFWLLSRTLGLALPVLSGVADEEMSFFPALEPNRPANTAYDAGLQSRFV
jgi:hypothetical protein